MYELKVILYIEVMIVAGLMFWRWAASPGARAVTDGKIELVALALPFAVFLMPQIWGLYLVCLLLVPALAKDKPQAVGLFLLAAAMTPQLSQPQVLGGTYLLAAATVTFLTIGLISGFARPGGVGRTPIVIDALVVGLALAIAITGMRSGGVPIRPITEAVLTILLPYFLISRLLADGDSLRRALIVLVFAGVLLTTVSAFEAFRHWPLYQEAYAHYGMPLPDLSSAIRIRGGLMRAPTTFPESTSFGLLLGVVLVATAANRSIAKGSGAHVAMLVFLTIGIIATVSRGAIIGSALALAVVGAYRGYAKQAFSTLAGFGAVTATLFLILPQGSRFHQMFGAQGYGTTGVADYRVALWEQGTALVRENPLVGLPVETVVARLSSLRAGGMVDFVNTYLYFAMTSGAIGATIFASVIIVPFMSLMAARRRLGPEQVALASGIAGTLAMFAFAFFFTSFYERNSLWLLLTVASAAVVLRARSAVPTVAPAPEPEPRDAAGLTGVSALPSLR